MAENLMMDTMEADIDRLPNTGCDSEWERQLSSIFVEVDTKLVSLREVNYVLILLN